MVKKGPSTAALTRLSHKRPFQKNLVFHRVLSPSILMERWVKEKSMLDKDGKFWNTWKYIKEIPTQEFWGDSQGVTGVSASRATTQRCVNSIAYGKPLLNQERLPLIVLLFSGPKDIQHFIWKPRSNNLEWIVEKQSSDCLGIFAHLEEEDGGLWLKNRWLEWRYESSQGFLHISAEANVDRLQAMLDGCSNSCKIVSAKYRVHKLYGTRG